MLVLRNGGAEVVRREGIGRTIGSDIVIEQRRERPQHFESCFLDKCVVVTFADTNVTKVHLHINTKAFNILAVAAGLHVRLDFLPTSSNQCNNSCNTILPF